jgi:hypothetical protein
MKLKVYKAVRKYKVELAWEIEVDASLKDRGHTWFKNALNKEFWDIDQDQLDIRAQFNLSGIEQGDLICVGGSQCYII